MCRRWLGSILFLIPALCLFEIAGRLASEGRGGWAWFLLVGCWLAGSAVCVSTGEWEGMPDSRLRKPEQPDELP
jgi:hypothetical protein